MRGNTYNNTFITYDDDMTWLVTYADLMTILLVFFVLLYTLAFYEKEQYRHAVETIKVQVEEDENLIGLMELMEIPETVDTQITIEDITGLHSREKSLFENITKFARSSSQNKNISTRTKRVQKSSQDKKLLPDPRQKKIMSVFLKILNGLQMNQILFFLLQRQ